MYVCKPYEPTVNALQEGAEVAKIYKKGKGNRWTDGINPCPGLRMAVVDKMISSEDCQKIVQHNRQGLPMEFCRSPSDVSWHLIDVPEYLDRVFGKDKYPVLLNTKPENVAEILLREI